jgi:hypothetical protein
MNKFKTSAVEVLNKHEKPLHVREITRIALNEGILETDGATPERSMNANISVDIKENVSNSDFVRTAPSTYSLNKDKHKYSALIQPFKNEKKLKKQQEIESSFTGKGRGVFGLC